MHISLSGFVDSGMKAHPDTAQANKVNDLMADVIAWDGKERKTPYFMHGKW